MEWLNYWDRSLFNRPIIFKAKLLYHGTTLDYFNERIKNGARYYEHIENGLSESSEKEVFFETNKKNAISWTCSFSKRFNSPPVIISTKNLRDLRRNSINFYPYHRSDKVPIDDLIMIPLVFKNDIWKKRLF